MRFRSLVLLVVVVGVAAMAVRPSFDTDTWWHLRAGQWIVENLQAPRIDSFSSTMRGSPWAYPGWLAQVVMLGVYRLGGLAGLTAFSAVLVGVAFLFLWPLLEGPLLLRAAILLLAAATSAVYWAARPHIASFALAALFLWALDQWHRGRRPRVIWLLPLAMALWVNLHGGFAIGFILLLMYFAAALVDLVAIPVRHRGTWGEAWRVRRGEVATLAAVLLLCLAAGAVNPHGPAILAYPFKTVSLPVLQSYVQEWQPPDLRTLQLLPFLGMLLFLIVALGIRRTTPTTTELFTAGGWMALALLAVRNVPVFALAAAPVIARHTSAALRSVDRGPASGTTVREKRALNAALGAGLLTLLLAWTAVQASPGRTRAHLEAQVPVAAVQSMRELRPDGNLFNDYNWGGYVLWELSPAYSTFVDGRTDVFSAEVFEDYVLLWATQPGWEAAIERWNIAVVLLPPRSPLVTALREAGWEARFSDDQAVVLLRPRSG
ncbi:MAG: hypothetical protein HW404_1428 [Anaerolineales bacterium]|nr:hypothetical protein [Anaerolineales bacterium]